MTFNTSNDNTTVVLKPFSWEHVKKTYCWVSDPLLRTQFLLRGELSWEGHKTYFRKVLNDPSQLVFAVLTNGQHVGNCGFKNITTYQEEGELWIYLGETETRGKGIGLRATRLLIDEGFYTWDLR
jgi:RimJ/RimL family protein N-acetyltransferase